MNEMLKKIDPLFADLLLIRVIKTLIVLIFRTSDQEAVQLFVQQEVCKNHGWFFFLDARYFVVHFAHTLLILHRWQLQVWTEVEHQHNSLH